MSFLPNFMLFWSDKFESELGWFSLRQSHIENKCHPIGLNYEHVFVIQFLHTMCNHIIIFVLSMYKLMVFIVSAIRAMLCIEFLFVCRARPLKLGGHFLTRTRNVTPFWMPLGMPVLSQTWSAVRPKVISVSWWYRHVKENLRQALNAEAKPGKNIDGDS